MGERIEKAKQYEAKMRVLKLTDYFEFDYDENDPYDNVYLVDFGERYIDGIPFITLAEDGESYDFKIPDFVTRLSVYLFDGCENAYNLYIHKNHEMLFENGIYNISGWVRNYFVDEENPHYTSIDGVLFCKDKTRLVDYPCLRKNKIYEIPEGTLVIEKNAFEYYEYLKKLIIPKSIKLIENSNYLFGYNAIELEISEENVNYSLYKNSLYNKSHNILYNINMREKYIEFAEETEVMVSSCTLNPQIQYEKIVLPPNLHLIENFESLFGYAMIDILLIPKHLKWVGEQLKRNDEFIEIEYY